MKQPTKPWRSSKTRTVFVLGSSPLFVLGAVIGLIWTIVFAGFLYGIDLAAGEETE